MNNPMFDYSKHDSKLGKFIRNQDTNCGDVTIRRHTPREENLVLKCQCVKCLPIDDDEEIGPPVSVSHSFSLERLESDKIVGVYRKNK
jgi:hypothetical protein